jgi:anti-anti-sigma factor
MQTNVERLEDRTVVQPAEDLVGAGVGELRTALRDIAGASSGDLVLDLQKVRMIDSSGIGLLVAAHNSMRRQGASLSVVHASADILHLMRSMRIHQHFEVSGD